MKVKQHGIVNDTNDCIRLNELVKEIDNDFDVVFNQGNGVFTVTHKGFHFMDIPFNELNRDTLFHIRKVVHWNKEQTLLQEIDRHNEKVQKQKDREIENFAENLAKDIRKPLIKEWEG